MVHWLQDGKMRPQGCCSWGQGAAEDGLQLSWDTRGTAALLPSAGMKPHSCTPGSQAQLGVGGGRFLVYLCPVSN